MATANERRRRHKVICKIMNGLHDYMGEWEFKVFSFFLLYPLITNYSMAEIIPYPYYESRDCGLVQIDSINRTDIATIIYGRYRYFDKGESWCNIDPEAKLIDCNTGLTYKIRRSEGIFMAPSRTRLTAKTEMFNIALYFDPIPESTQYIDLIENNKSGSIKFYGIDLTGKKQNDSTPGFEKVELPEFPGGEEAAFQWLSNNIEYPAKAYRDGITGRVVAAFVIEEDGSIGDIKIVSSPHPLLSQATIKVLSKMPKWKPGTVNGKPVRHKYQMPLTFNLK